MLNKICLSFLLKAGNANILPVIVKYESNKNTATKNENRSSNSVFNVLRKREITEIKKRK